MDPIVHIKEEIIAALKTRVPYCAGVEPRDLVYPPDAQFGDISLPCFAFSKELKKNPAEVAQDIAALCAEKWRVEMVQAVSATGPYVNFTVRADVIADLLLSALRKEKTQFGTNTIGKGERVMIEYPSPNTHKEFHIGHVRNVCIGVSLVHLYEMSGYKVVPVNYINDFGAHVAKCLWALQKFHANERPPRGHEARWLGALYVEGAQKLAEDEQEYGREVSAILQKLESHERTISTLWKKTRRWSMKGMHGYLDELGARFKHEFYESEVKDEGKHIAQELLKKGIAHKSLGAVIIDMEHEGLGVMLLLKTDGTGLYATSDLALARRKFKLFKIDRSINITDVRQSHYFKQLFHALQMSDFHQQMTHIGYEFVRLPEGAMASRTGRVILYEDMRDEIVRAASEETRTRHPAWSARKIQNTAHTLALAALKFGMLKHDPAKVIVFDKKEALSFEGFTGSYVLYTLARMHSIFKKVKRNSGRVDAHVLTSIYEKRFAWQCMRFGEVVEQATRDNNPSALAHYLYTLCQFFGSFYEHCSVIHAENSRTGAARLALIHAGKQVLEQGLAVLGIPLLKEM